MIGDLEYGRLSNRDANAEFFGQLTGRCVGVRLTWLGLAAWEFPETAVALVKWALANKQRVTAAYDACDDAARGRAHVNEL